MRRSLVWALFVLCLMGAAALSASASERILGPSRPVPTCQPVFDPASTGFCARRDPTPVLHVVDECKGMYVTEQEQQACETEQHR
jgi:hypothetical protein